MNRFLVRFSLVAMAAIAFATVATTAATQTGTVNGSVMRDGTPVAGAKVVIDSENNSTYGAETHTNEEGTFTFSGAPLGTVNITVYDAKDQLVVNGKAELTFQGQVITITLEIAP